MPAGYSGTPLAKKLGVKDGQPSWRYGMPASVAEEIARFARPIVLKEPIAGVAMAHIFVTQRSDLRRHLCELRGLLDPSGTIWVSWPKKSANVATEVTKDVVRAEAFPLNLVDVKVCAVDEIWSGLKLVVRKAARPQR